MLRSGVETFLKQLEAQIVLLSQTDRDQVVRAIAFVVGLLEKYGKPKITKAAIVKLVGAYMLAQAADAGDRFKEKLQAKARETGPNVAAIFSTL